MARKQLQRTNAACWTKDLFVQKPTYSYPFGPALYDATALVRRRLSPLSDQGEVVAAAVTFLQEERRATAANLALGDDGNAVAQDVRLVHVVRGQDDGATWRETQRRVRSMSPKDGFNNAGVCPWTLVCSRLSVTAITNKGETQSGKLKTKDFFHLDVCFSETGQRGKDVTNQNCSNRANTAICLRMVVTYLLIANSTVVC